MKIKKSDTGGLDLVFLVLIIGVCSWAALLFVPYLLHEKNNAAFEEMKIAADDYGWNVVGWYMDEYGKKDYLDILKKDAANDALSYYGEGSDKLHFQETEQNDISSSDEQSSDYEDYEDYESYDSYDNSDVYYNDRADEYYPSYEYYYDNVLLSGDIIDERVVNCQTYLNVRDDPSTSGSILCHLYPGTVVYITGMEDSWVYVYDIDRDDPNFEPGWVSEDYLD